MTCDRPPRGDLRDAVDFIMGADALRHDWSRPDDRCLSCGLTAEDCFRMGVAPHEVYCKARYRATVGSGER